MNNDAFNERRKYYRITKHFILRYFDISVPEKKYSASQLKNISEGGMCLITETSFATGTMLGVEIKTPFFAEVTFLKGEVLASHERAKNIIYETRLEFRDLSPEAIEVIKHTVEFFKNKENNHD